MASYTSRIILTLAVPSIFGILSILFFKKKKLSSCKVIETEDKVSLDSIPYESLSSMKLKSQQSCPVEESACSGEMQLKENETAPVLSSNCNGVSQSDHLKQNNGSENGISHVSNGVSHQSQINCQFREMQAVAVKENGITNGAAQSIKLQMKDTAAAVSDEKISNFDINSTLNGVKRKTKKTVSASNGISNTNGNPESTLNQKPNSHNGVGELSSASNGYSHSTHKTKSKKKGKGKLHENGSSCLKELAINGCKKDNTPLVSKDSENELSNGIAALSVRDEARSLYEQIRHVIGAQKMDKNSCSVVQPDVAEGVTTFCSQLDTSTVLNGNESSVTVPNSVCENDYLVPENVVIKAAKEECDTVDPLSLLGAHCCTPESGRSSNSSEFVDNIHTDVNEPLTFSVDLVASGSQEDTMLESPGATYCDSLGSNDSGRGASEILGFDPQPSSMVYEFDIPSDHCGYLIGKKGNHVHHIKEKTNATIWIRNFPFDKEKKIVSIAGEENEIQAALKLIRKRFPLKEYPHLTLEQSTLINTEILCPPSLKLALPEGVEFQVVLSATVNAGNFFIQLPTHASYHALPPFTMSMTSMYTHCHSPVITNLYIGNVVAAPVGDGWFRAEVVEIFTEDDTCKLKYLDYGGYQIVPRTALRQINIEFMQMPFQATECYLAGVTCHDELGWTEESKIAFETLAQGQILSAYVAGIAEDGVPCLYLYQVTGATNTFINQALVETGLLRWITSDQ